MKPLLVVLLAVALAPSLAHAGGGSKPNSTVKVKNNGSDTLAVVVDPSSSVSTSLSGGTLNTTTFLRGGGRFVGPGGVAVIGGLKAGSHTVTGAYISGTGSGANVGAAGSTTVNAQKGKTVTVVANGSVGSAANLVVQ